MVANLRPLAQHYNILGVYDDLSLDVGVYPTQRGEDGGAGAGAGKGMGGETKSPTSRNLQIFYSISA